MPKKTRNEQIMDHFNKAENYHSAAVVQRIVAHRLSEHIAQYFADYNHKPQTILELGCGTGLLTYNICHLWPQASIVATDYAPRMLERAQIMVQTMALKNVHFHRMDIEHLDRDGPFDLICGSLVLQWVANPKKVLKRLSERLAPNGMLAFSTLVRGTFAQWQAACEAVGGQSGISHYPDLVDMQAMIPFPCAGLWQHERVTHPFQSGLAFVQHLKETGASIPRHESRPLSVAKFRSALRQFEAMGSTVTWEVAYGCFRKPPRAGVFVTGTDTDVGKTVVSACLTQRWRGSYWKPLQTGLAKENGDTATIQQLVHNPVCFPPALACQASLSPEAAARIEAIDIDPLRLTLPESDPKTPLIVEGAGGVKVPITDTHFMSDLMSLWGLPVVLVARSGLGTLNHTLLTIEALRKRGITLVGVVLNGPENPGNKQAIEEKGHTRILAELPPSGILTPDKIDHLAQKFPLWSDL